MKGGVPAPVTSYVELNPDASPVRRGRAWLWVAGIVSGLVVGLTVLWQIEDGRERRALEAARAAFAAQGFPTQFAEITRPPVAADDDAGPRLLAAWGRATGKAEWEETELLPAFRELAKSSALALCAGPLDSAQVREWQTRIADTGVVALAAELRAATQRPGWNRRIDTELGPNNWPREPRPARDLVNMLATIALIENQSTDTAPAAWTNLTAAMTIAHRIDDAPSLIGMLTGFTCRRTVQNAAITALEHRPEAAEVAALLHVCQRELADASDNLARTQHAERMVMLDWSHAHHIEGRENWVRDYAMATGGSIFGFGGKLEPWLSPAMSCVGRPFLARELRRSYGAQLDAAIAIRRGGRGMVARLEGIAQQLEAEGGQLAPAMFQIIPTAAASHVIDVARQRAFIVLLATWQLHATTGAWPEDLAALGLDAETLTDPASGRTLVLRANDDELVVYGFGFDGDDDGGGTDVEAPYASSVDGDIALRVVLTGGELR